MQARDVAGDGRVVDPSVGRVRNLLAAGTKIVLLAISILV